MGMFDIPPKQPRVYACCDCGRHTTEEQIFNAAGKVQDLDALMSGRTPWLCTLCQTKRIERTRQNAARSIDLAPTEALILELFKRYGHVIVAFRTIPVEGVNDAMEGLYHNGDYRMCQGLAQGVIGKMERDIVAATDRRRSQMEEAQES